MANKSAVDVDIRAGVVSVKCSDHILYEEALEPGMVIPRAKLITNGDVVKIMWPRTEVRVENGVEVISEVPGWRQFDIIRGATVSEVGRGKTVRQAISGMSALLRDDLRLPVNDCHVTVEVGPVGCFK